MSQTSGLQPVVHSEERLQRLVEMTIIIPWEADVESWLFTFGGQATKMLGYINCSAFSANAFSRLSTAVLHLKLLSANWIVMADSNSSDLYSGVL